MVWCEELRKRFQRAGNSELENIFKKIISKRGKQIDNEFKFTRMNFADTSYFCKMNVSKQINKPEYRTSY
jgi:hypothetical protein